MAHGTTLHLTGLSDTWDDESFARLRAELARLVSRGEGNDDFAIALDLPPQFSEYAGPVMPPAVLGRPRYKLAGEIDAKGRFAADYEGPDTKAAVRIADRVTLADGRAPNCGPFRFDFKVWDRDESGLGNLASELGSTVRELRRDLDAASGISIYRDNFRILLGDSDWLRLDLRRVQNPTMRLSNNQIVGSVFISAEGNAGLRDQTNREGLVGGPSLEDFKRTMIELLSQLEIKRDSHRRAQKPPERIGGLFQELDIKPLREFVQNRYPNDVELRTVLDGKARSFEHGVVEIQRVLARYRRLAALGQLIDVVLHEGRTPVASISNEVTLGARDLERSSEHPLTETMKGRLETIAEQAEMLSALFRRLAPFSGRKRGRPAKVAIERVIKAAFALYERRITDLEVDVRLPESETVVTVDEGEMQQIIVNLLDNSLYWLEKIPAAERRIAVEVSRSAEELAILFSDSGPGVAEDVRDRIFDPYFSTKPDGVGLGLTIAGETAAEYDGSLELVAGGPLRGATFRIGLKRRLGEADA